MLETELTYTRELAADLRARRITWTPEWLRGIADRAAEAPCRPLNSRTPAQMSGPEAHKRMVLRSYMIIASRTWAGFGASGR